MPTSFWMKFKQGFLLISLLLSCHGWGVAQNPGVTDGENSFSYLWQHVRVRLEIDPVSMAVFIPDAEDSILVVERQLRSLGIQEQVLSIKETPYPGLLILHPEGKQRRRGGRFFRFSCLWLGLSLPAVSRSFAYSPSGDLDHSRS